jgi:hypothetical protein
MCLDGVKIGPYGPVRSHRWAWASRTRVLSSVSSLLPLLSPLPEPSRRAEAKQPRTHTAGEGEERDCTGDGVDQLRRRRERLRY